MIKISIIMPLYNAGNYLEEALLSIRKQTFREYEVICINDASTDNTLDILHRFQNIDSRIRIINHSERSGAAVSRNRGIVEAKGKYLSFLDGDDVFDEGMLELAYQNMEIYDADIVMFEYKHVLSQHIYEKASIQRSRQFIEKYCNNPFSVRDFEPIEFMNWSCSPCNKLYRKSFIDLNQLKFQTLTSANDMYFVTMVLLLSSRLIMLEDRRVMLYARDHNVVTRISYERDPMCAYQAMMKLGDELVKRGLFHKLFQYYYCILFYNLRSAIIQTKNIEKAKQFYEFLQNEGMDHLVRGREEYYLKTDERIHDMLENYKNLDFTSNWYQSEEVINFYLFKNKERLLSFFQSNLRQNKQIVVWGAGKKGRILLEFLKNCNIGTIKVADSDGDKQEKVICGYKIKRPEDCLQKAQVVITSSLPIYNEVAAMLQETDIEVIDIGEILGMP